MPETASLQIRDRGSKTARVVALSGELVRIGRSAVCDVLLLDPNVARLECRLTRDADETWTIVPERIDSKVTVDGKRLVGPQTLEFDRTFRVGDNLLMLRSGSSSVSMEDVVSEERVVDEFSGKPDLKVMEENSESGTEGLNSLIAARAETRKWESRWRAVGEKLRETSTTAPSVPPSARKPAEPYRPGASRPVDRPMPAPTTSHPHTREIPIRSHSASHSVRRPPRPEPSAASIPTPRPSFQGLSRPPTATSLRREVPIARPVVPSTPRESEPLRARVESSPAEVVEVIPAEIEAPTLHPASDFLLQTPLLDEEDEDRNQEPVASRTLGATRRISRPVFETIEPVLNDSAASSDELDVAEEEADAFQSAFEESAPTAPIIDSPSDLEEKLSEALTEEEIVPPERSESLFTETFRQDVIGWEASPAPSASMFSNRERSEAVGDFESRRDRLHRSPLDLSSPQPNRDSQTSQDWPSVSDIFASRRSPARTAAANAKAVPTKPRPAPTVSREPDQWNMPVWLGWFPATAASLFITASIVGLNWFWTVDNHEAGMVARRLDPKSGLKKPLPEGVEPGPTQWWRASDANLLTWSQYLDRFDNDPGKLEEARRLLQKASEISPLSPTVRHALAQKQDPSQNFGPSDVTKAVGQSRDIVTFTHAGRQLLKAGKLDSAREAYRLAMEMAVKTDLEQPTSPILEGSQIRRYSLPTEDLLAPIIRDMAGRTEWTFDDWRIALPKRSVAPLVAARVLSELHSRDASAALDLALDDPISETLLAASTRTETIHSAVLLAAEAEALAMKSRLKEAMECYRSAIDRMPADVVSRSWWLNTAEIAKRLNQDPERRKALEMAKNDDSKDEITLNAIELQRDAGDLAVRPKSQAKSDPQTKAASVPVD